MNCARRRAGRLTRPTALLLPLLVGVFASNGCAGGGKVQLVSLDFRSIDPPTPRVFELSFDHCVWWTDPDGHLWLTMDRDVRSIFGALGRVQFEMSLRLDRLPNGKARNYSIADDEVRVRIRTALTETRLTSLSGILAIYREGDDSLRGSFRFQANRYTLQILGGWTPGARFLFLGQFTAGRDPGIGAAIVESTEGTGFERGEPTSRPSRAATQSDAARP